MDDEDFIASQREETEILKEEVRRLSEQVERNNKKPVSKETVDILDLPPSSIGVRYGTLSARLKTLTDLSKSLGKG